MGDLGRVRACGFEDLEGECFDVVINGTSAGLGGELPPLPDDLLREGATCLDMVYADEPTVFVRWARAHGAALAVDGLGMLVEQAAESFRLWRGVRPETAAVIEAMRGEGS
jgi:shikimate dehydrogenase